MKKMNDDWCVLYFLKTSALLGKINEIYLSRAQVGYIELIEEKQ